MADIDWWQRAAVALDEWFCNGEKGRDKRDPVYRDVTQNRDGVLVPFEKYSSCADRAHAKLWRIGVRAPFVNRNEQPGGWKVGLNISELWNAKHGSPSIVPDEHWLPEPGDELVIWNTGMDAHSLSIISYDAANHSARTANYGTAGMSKSVFPGARVSPFTPLVYTHSSGWVCGHRRVQRVLKLADVLKLATAKPNLKDLEGAYLIGDGGTLDELEGT